MGTIGPGTTLTAGVQDIAALLPLLGTEQCEDHVGSALTKGFLYAAATPLSIFGSLGLARAGMKTLVAACVIPKWSIFGAQILADMGFKPQGTNLSLIMIDEGDKDGRYLVKRRLDELLKELHLDKLRGIDVACKCAKWNMMLISATFVSCLFSITPYIYINIEGNLSLNQQARWTFPILRAVGGFLTTTMMQLVIQTRIITLTENWLNLTIRKEHLDQTINDAGSHDVEKALSVQNILGGNLHSDVVADDGNSFLIWCWLILLLGGILAVIVGYIGCFSVVQSSRTFWGPLSWLCIEAALSVIRMILWGRNPTWDDAPPLELVLPLERNAPLPTCMKYEDEILQDRVLPLTRASEFLESITSFIGLIEHFSHPDLTLYYTLTRKSITDSNGQAEEVPKNRILYITIFHHKERTTRVYTGDQFHSTAGGLVIDLDHNQLETTLGESINLNHDPVAADAKIRSQLLRHHEFIINGIDSTALEGSTIRYTIKNQWTMRGKDTNGYNEPCTSVTSGDSSLKDDSRFLEHGRLERMRRSLVETRGKWIEDYMKWVIQETEKSVPIGIDLPHRMIDTSPKVGKHNGSEEERGELKDGDLNGEKAETEIVSMNERYHMEMLLVEEVQIWENKLLHKMQRFFDDLDRIPAKKHLISTQSSNCWRRLNAEIRAMDARMNTAQSEKDPRRAHASVLAVKWEAVHQRIRKAWESVVNQYVGTSGSESLPSPSLQSTSLLENLESELNYSDQELNPLWQNLSERPKNRCRKRREEMVVRLRKEAQDIDTRSKGDLESCNEFWNGLQYVGLRHSQPKWRVLSKDVFQKHENLKKYLLVLSRASHVTHFNCWSFEQADVNWIFERIRDMPLITSIHFHGIEGHKCPSIENNDHLLSITGDVVLTPGIKKVLERNASRSKQTVLSLSIGLFFSIDNVHGNHEVGCDSGRRATISFFGPPSGNIILRLVHYADHPDTTIVIVQGLFELTLPVSQGSWMTDDIILHPHLSFQPDERNELTVSVSAKKHFYHIKNIQLLNDPTL